MAKKAKKSAAPRAGVPDVSGMEYWRAQALALVPDESEDWRIGEVATMLKLQSKLLTENWKIASPIGDRAENDTLQIGFSVKIERKQTPPTVRVVMNYSEPHRSKASSDVPDPSQDELPGIAKEEEQPAANTASAKVEEA